MLANSKIITISDLEPDFIDENGPIPDQDIICVSHNFTDPYELLMEYRLFDELKLSNDKVYFRDCNFQPIGVQMDAIVFLDWKPLQLRPSECGITVYPTYIEVIKKGWIVYLIVENTAHNMELLMWWNNEK